MLLLKTLNTEVGLMLKFKNVCVAMCSLVMSLSSRDHLEMSSCIINHGSKFTVA